jgi:hypothetical protein
MVAAGVVWMKVAGLMREGEGAENDESFVWTMETRLNAEMRTVESGGGVAVDWPAQNKSKKSILLRWFYITYPTQKAHWSFSRFGLTHDRVRSDFGVRRAVNDS